MAKKEFPDKEFANKGFSKKDAPVKEEGSGLALPKISGLSHHLFGIVKILLGICILPFVYGITVAFVGELNTIDKPLQDYFWKGIISLLVVYLFVWEPAIIYAKGHKLLEIVFSFIKSLVKVAPYLIPIYTLVVFVAYLVLGLFIKSPSLINYFMFAMGLSISLHLIFGAKSLRGKKDDFLKSNYIFGFSFVYITSLVLVALCLNFIFEKYSVVNFCNNTLQTAKIIFNSVFGQLFIIR